VLYCGFRHVVGAQKNPSHVVALKNLLTKLIIAGIKEGLDVRLPASLVGNGRGLLLTPMPLAKSARRLV